MSAACLLLAATLTALGSNAPEATEGQDETTALPWSFLEAHCAKCHKGADAEAGVVLCAVEPPPIEDETWQLLIDLVTEGDMPPRGQPRPSGEDLEAFLTWAQTAHPGATTVEGPLDPGRPVLRRLNQREHENALAATLGVRFDLEAWLPADVIGYGFDRIGETQTLSDDLLERYLDLAEAASLEAWNAFGPEDVRVRRFAAEELSGSVHGDVVVLATTGVSDVAHDFPCGGPYRLRVRAHGQQAGPEPCRMGLTLDGSPVSKVVVQQTRGEPGVFETVVNVTAGSHRVGGAFLNDYYRPEAERPEDRDRNLVLHWVELEGPLEFPAPTPLQVELTERFPAELGSKRLERTIAELARRLWRRPVTRDESRRIVRRIDSQQSYDKQVQDSIVLLLLSPQFLFRFEQGGTAEELAVITEDLGLARGVVDGTLPLTGHELATRLSFFLWSTSPDEELRRAAEAGELSTSAGILAQTTRMLADPRASTFARDFAGQWLQLRKLERISLPEGVSSALRASMMEETKRFFEALLFEDHDLRALLDADFSFRDELLAQHYGEAAPVEPGWTRVSLEGPRRGVVAHASILTLTSEPTRTSPVRRGKWLLETLLNEPPPPPPVDAGSFRNDGVGASAADLREELALHRARAECAPCHDAMDPLGLALENFGPTGIWREEDGGQPIDASTKLPDGRTLEGPQDLSTLLREDPAFLRAVTERVFVYALGRPLERTDRESVSAVVEALDPAHPTLRGVLEGIVTSAPFRLLGPSE